MSDATRRLPPQISIETLMSERPWVEALARSLVRDEATADDVVQQTWLAALAHPPRESSALRGWLARVVRNTASDSRRSAARRAAHEASAMPPRGEPSPEETVARAEAHRGLVEAVMAMDEPYRTAILLRYFEGLDRDEVARRTGVPVDTARTRIKRALAMLRVRLDREHGGGGRAWALALAPLTGVISPENGAVVTGGAVMAATTKTVIVLAVGALLGAVVTAGTMGALREDAAAPGARRVEIAAPDGDVAPGGAPRRTAAASPESSSAPPPAATPAAPPGSALAAAFDEVQIAPPQFVTGSITGHVRTKAGEPAEGVTIRATTQRVGATSRRPSGQAPATTAEDTVRDAIAYAKWNEATKREGQTDASGAFTLTRLVDGKYHVSATATSYSIRPAPGADTSNAKPGSVVDFVATAVLEVPVTVLMPDGTAPTEQILVRWSEPGRGGGSSSWWTEANPVVRVEPGKWELVAEVGKDVRSKPVPIEATAGVARAPVTLRLEERNVIRGVVRLDPADAGWESIEVTAKRRGSTDAREIRPESARPPDWKFRFDDVPAGEYDVTASFDHDSAPLTSSVVVVAVGPVDRDLVIPRLTPDQFIVLRVLGPDGNPLPKGDVDLQLRAYSPQGAIGFGSRGSYRPDGTLLVPLPTHVRGMGDIDPAAEWTVDVTSKSAGARTVAFVRGTTQSVDVNLAEVAKFEPTIVGAEGTPLAGRLRVMLQLAGQDESNLYDGNNEPPGPRSVAPGRYVGILWLSKGDRGAVLARVPLELRDGPNPVTFNVPEIFTLTIRVPGLEKGSKIDVRPARRPGRHGFEPAVVSGEGGVATISELPAGLYGVMVTIGGEPREMIVRLPASGEVTFAPTTIAGLAVTVEDPSGVLASAGFQSGDLIVSIDGTAIDTSLRADHLLYASHGRESVVVEVLRGGARMSLPIEAAKFGRYGRYGGWWEPVLR